MYSLIEFSCVIPFCFSTVTYFRYFFFYNMPTVMSKKNTIVKTNAMVKFNDGKNDKI